MGALVVALAVLCLLPVIFRWPMTGILAWFWIGLMNPHRLVYGALNVMPFAAIIGGATLIAWLASTEKKRIPATPITLLLLLIAIWITWTTYNASMPDFAWPKWEQTLKILLMTAVTIPLMAKRERIHILIWVTVLSLGYYGFKGGLFTLVTGGEAHVWGPPRSFIGDNNALAMALTMLLPLLRYLQLQTESRLLRICLIIGMVLIVFSIIGSQSRGAFLAVVSMASFMILKSRNRFSLGLAAIVVASIAIWFVPDSWVDRMETIQTYEEDSSAMERIMAWRFSYEIAKKRPLTGGGFGVYYDKDLYFSIIPEAKTTHNAHSIYFEIIGQHGFIGFVLFMGLLVATWRCFSKIIKLTKSQPQLAWAKDLSALCQVSLIAYMVGGAFQNLAFFDFYFLFVSLAAVTLLVIQTELETSAEPTAKISGISSLMATAGRTTPPRRIVRPVSARTETPKS